MKVQQFEQKAFDDFLEISLKDWKVDSSKILVLGIKDGGVPPAERVFEVIKQTDNKVDLKFIKCQRPSTSIKKKNEFRKTLIKTVFKLSPVLILDLLRNLEHYLLTKKNIEVNRDIILEEVIDFKFYDKIIIVDDAVDSGVTLEKVNQYIENLVDKTTVVKSLAVVVTNKQAVVTPDYYLYKDVLIRFPWSLDGK